MKDPLTLHLDGPMSLWEAPETDRALTGPEKGWRQAVRSELDSLGWGGRKDPGASHGS
jgi:hypothetical protein